MNENEKEISIKYYHCMWLNDRGIVILHNDNEEYRKCRKISIHTNERKEKIRLIKHAKEVKIVTIPEKLRNTLINKCTVKLPSLLKESLEEKGLSLTFKNLPFTREFTYGFYKDKCVTYHAIAIVRPREQFIKTEGILYVHDRIVKAMQDFSWAEKKNTVSVEVN